MDSCIPDAISIVASLLSTSAQHVTKHGVVRRGLASHCMIPPCRASAAVAQMVWTALRCRTAAQGGAAESVRTLHVDDSTVLKLAVGPSLAAVAVTTFHGLYLADFSSTSGSPGACLAASRVLGTG